MPASHRPIPGPTLRELLAAKLREPVDPSRPPSPMGMILRSKFAAQAAAASKAGAVASASMRGAA